MALFLLFDLVFKLCDVIVDLSKFSHCFLRPPAAVNVDNKQVQRTSLDREKADEQIIWQLFSLARILFKIFVVKVTSLKNSYFKVIKTELYIVATKLLAIHLMRCIELYVASTVVKTACF